MKNINRFFAIVLFIVFSVSAWGAEGDTHDFAQTLEQVLNNGVSISNVTVPEQSYTVKKVIVTVNYNKSRPGATVSVKVGETTFGSPQTINSSTTTTFEYENSTAVKGTVTISSQNNCTSSSGNGTFKITNVRLVEGASAACDNVVKVQAGTPEHGSFSLSKTGDQTTCSGALTVNVNDITPASGYQFSAITQSGIASGVTIDQENKTVTYAKDSKGTSTINVTFEAIPTRTIRFFDNGTKISEQSVAQGGSPAVPSNPAGCEDFTFLGWWTAELAEDNTTSHTWITDFTVTGNQDYYAVYQHAGGGSTIVSFDATVDPATKGGITLSVTGGALNNGTDYRVWKNQTMTITSSAGNMSSIVLTFENASYDGGGWASSYSPNAGTWTSPTASGEQAHITNIVITVGSVFYTSTADCRSCYEPTLSFDVTSVNKFVGDDKFTYTATPANNPMGGTVTYTSNKPTKASVNSSTGEVTILDAMSDEPITITATLGVVDDGINCQKKATATYTLNVYNKVTWLVNGVAYHEGSPTEQTTEGGSITSYPTDPDGDEVCGGKTFVGWTNAPYPENDAAPTILYTSLSSMSGVHPTDNVTFYAVFAEAGGGSDEIYTKGTSSDLEEGKKVVIVHAASNKALSSTSTANKTLTATYTTISSNQITNPTSDLIWIVSEAGSYYRFLHGDGYLWAGYDDKYILYGTDDYDDRWSVTANGGHYYITDVDYNNRKLEYYNDEFTTYTGTGTNYQMDFYFLTTSYSAYSTTCGPNIKVGEVERLTSTKDQTVKSQAISVKGSNLTADGTLGWSISGGDASYFSCELASNTISADGAIETTFVVRYRPGNYDYTPHTATLTFNDGTTNSNPVTLLGRSLPEHFAIVGYDGAHYYVLDGSMTSASTVKAIQVTVTGDAVDLCPSQAIYTLTERGTPDQNVHLVGPTNRLLFGGSSTNLNTHPGGEEGTGWLLATNDFDTYHITNATTTDRGIMYNDANNVFGHYKLSNYSGAHYFGDIRLMRITDVCTCLPMPNPTSVARSETATITWEEIDGAVSYDVSCSGGSVVVNGLQATISGLSSSTHYTYTVKAVASGADCSLTYNGAFTTTNCDDVPSAISVVPALKSATFRWTMTAASATIRIYSNEECTAQVGSDHTGQTSPATITGLAENTQYYAKIFAGGGCESAVIPFLTKTTTVEIAEWFPDSIRINLGADESTASVIIEDKQEKTTGSTNVADKLFFSKYFEADGNNKMIAIYNGTADPIDITNMWLKHSNKGAAESRICLKRFGKTPGVIAPNEEIIIMRFTKDDDPAITCAEKEDNYEEWNIIPSTPADLQQDGEGNNIYNWLQFSGPQSIGLYDGNTNKFIDVIGATTDASGTGSLVQISASNKVTCSYTEKSANDGSGFYADGKEVDTDNDILLSTNRCLLIRKNTVKSGDDAVANNVYTTQEACDALIGESFQTLGTEWVGYVIGKGADAADKTCEGLAFVGGFDYQGYYVQYEEIKTVDELTGKKNDDGTYTIPIPLLDTLSCTMLRVKVYEGAVEKASTEYKVPIMIKTTDATTADDAYFHSYARETNSADVCRECDVVILKGATLTKASSDDTKDIDEVRNLTIYPGGTLIIPSGAKYEYTVNSLTMRVEGENVPFAKLKGTLNSATQQVIVTRRQDNSRPYFFSLPYDCNVSDIRWSNGETPVLGTDYRIMTYDGATRAAQGSANNGRFWTYLTETDVIHAGVGYNIQTPYQYLHELVFPMTLATTDVTTEEDDKAVITAIHQYTNSGTSINNHNWNLIAQPYISPFNPQEDGDIRYGWLDYHYDEGDNVIWERKDETHVYLTMPSFGASKVTYDQKLHSAAGVLNPFLAIFVQGAGEGDITFDKTNRILTAAPPRHLAAEAEHADESLFVGVTLTTNGKSDQTNVRLRPDFTNEYKLGYDLDKFITYYTERPQVYMVNGSRMAFRAVSDEVAANTAMPMGVYGEYAGTYTFALSEDYPIDYVEAVYLTDRETGQTTNLLYGTYSFQTSGRIYTESRFTLSVVVRREAPQTPTDIETVVSGAQQTRKILYNGQLYILQGGRVYDATGKQMLNR